MPTVTVIIATYNWSSVLPYAIASVLGQTFTDFELLVVGDGCTDDSEQVVAGINDPRVRWINCVPRYGHQSGPNNEGIRQARGRYIAYLGHDDLWLPHHLEVLVAALDAGADLAHSVVLILYPEGRGIVWTMPPTSVAHRRELTGEVGEWGDYRKLDVFPEVDLWERARAAGKRFTFVRRLSGIKPAAAWRRNVYRDRPCHEQAAWLQRIRSEPDLETTELVKVAFAGQEPPSYGVRIARLLVQPWRLPGAVWRRISKGPGRTIEKLKRFKGVVD